MSDDIWDWGEAGSPVRGYNWNWNKSNSPQTTRQLVQVMITALVDRSKLSDAKRTKQRIDNIEQFEESVERNRKTIANEASQYGQVWMQVIPGAWKKLIQDLTKRKIDEDNHVRLGALITDQSLRNDRTIALNTTFFRLTANEAMTAKLSSTDTYKLFADHAGEIWQQIDLLRLIAKHDLMNYKVIQQLDQMLFGEAKPFTTPIDYKAIVEDELATILWLSASAVK